jgi:hypothetical protein
MTLTLDSIPDHDTAPSGSSRTNVLKDLNPAPGRRAVLRAMALGAATLGAVTLNWTTGLGSRKAQAETGPGGLQGWDRNDCLDAYPSGYSEVPDTNGLYMNTYAACFGGTWRGSNYCNAGWHKHGTWYYGVIRGDHVPTSSYCGTSSVKNAWRWTTPDGIWYRCSDGFSTFYGGGYNGQTYLTICRF